MMMLVPKKGAKSREVLISTANTVMPEKNASRRTSHTRTLGGDDGCGED